MRGNNMGDPGVGGDIVIDDLEGLHREIQDYNEAGSNKPEDISPSLERYLMYVAKSGNIIFPWNHVKTLFRIKIQHAMEQFPGELCPNTESFVMERFDLFRAAPFTIQRLTELITQPTRHYKKKEKFLRGLEKTVLVVTTVEPWSLNNDVKNGNMEDDMEEEEDSVGVIKPDDEMLSSNNIIIQDTPLIVTKSVFESYSEVLASEAGQQTDYVEVDPSSLMALDDPEQIIAANTTPAVLLTSSAVISEIVASATLTPSLAVSNEDPSTVTLTTPSAVEIAEAVVGPTNTETEDDKQGFIIQDTPDQVPDPEGKNETTIPPQILEENVLVATAAATAEPWSVNDDVKNVMESDMVEEDSSGVIKPDIEASIVIEDPNGIVNFESYSDILADTAQQTDDVDVDPSSMGLETEQIIPIPAIAADHDASTVLTTPSAVIAEDEAVRVGPTAETHEEEKPGFVIQDTHEEVPDPEVKEATHPPQ